MLGDILTLPRVNCRITGSSKKKVLEHIAHTIGADDDDLSALPLLKKLIEREQLGSTGLGDGVAIPHCRTASVDTITACLVSLEHAVDFEATDDQDVDLLFALVVPETETSAHLDILAALAKIFSQESARKKLRNAANDTELFETFSALASTLQ